MHPVPKNGIAPIISSCSTTPSFFKDVGDILITGSSLINVENYTQFLQTSIANACHLLETNRVSGAELDSAVRHSPPRCHLNTRKALRERFTTWFVDPYRTSVAFWILGSPGIGKSAVAQTIAEDCRDAGCLGATFFFSDAFNDSTRIIATLVHQLVVRFPEYKQIVAQLLATDTTVFERNLRSQFQSLITQPLATLKEQGSTLLQQRLLIVLDGLEQCRPEGAQRELVSLIRQQREAPSATPLSWLICSRPERHIKALLSRPEARLYCRREELHLRDDGAQCDVYHVLQDGLEIIREEYSNVIGENWPLEEELRQLTDAAGGYFPFVSTILEIVGDREVNDPHSRLNFCLQAINSECIGNAGDPSKALKGYRERVLSLGGEALPLVTIPDGKDGGPTPKVAQEDSAEPSTTGARRDEQPVNNLVSGGLQWEVEQDTSDLVKALQSCPRTWVGLSPNLIEAARLVSGSRDKESLEEICFRGLGNAIDTSLDLMRSSPLIGPAGVGFWPPLVSPSEFAATVEDARKIIGDTKLKTTEVITVFQSSQRSISSALEDVDRKLRRDKRPPHQALIMDLIDGWRHLQRAKSQLIMQGETTTLFIGWWQRTEERLADLDLRMAGAAPRDDYIHAVCDNWRSLAHRIGSYTSNVHLT